MPSIAEPSHAVHTPFPCTVRDVPYGAGVFATRDIARGEIIMTIDGRTQSHPTRYSIQLDHGVHIEASATLPDAEMRVRHPWRFLNHCCAPNARVLGQSLLARQPIRAGEQVTFDYTTTVDAAAVTCTKCIGVLAIRTEYELTIKRLHRHFRPNGTECGYIAEPGTVCNKCGTVAP